MRVAVVGTGISGNAAAWTSWNFLRWPRQGDIDRNVDNDVPVTYC
jgi:hypothetical protein